MIISSQAKKLLLLVISFDFAIMTQSICLTNCNNEKLFKSTICQKNDYLHTKLLGAQYE